MTAVFWLGTWCVVAGFFLARRRSILSTGLTLVGVIIWLLLALVVLAR